MTYFHLSFLAESQGYHAICALDNNQYDIKTKYADVNLAFYDVSHVYEIKRKVKNALQDNAR